MSQAEPLTPTCPAPVDQADVGDHGDDPTRAFSTSIVISGIRCLLTYVIFPWVLPLFGVVGGVGPAIGLAVGTVAIFFNVSSIRRFQVSGHRWRWHITAINVAVIGLLTVLVIQDVGDLLA